MVERRRPSSPRDLEAALRIDPDDIDDCLVEQPGLFYYVAEAVSLANSQRDTAKLELEEAVAELDQQFRKTALAEKEKLTEAAIENRIKTAPRIKGLQRDYLEARTKADHCAALKEAYQQRSFMLRELVAMQLAQLHNLGLERGAVAARHAIGDDVRARAEELRRARREVR
jgi:hypothetical protein